MKIHLNGQFQTQLWSLIITGGGSLLLLISLGMLVNISRTYSSLAILPAKMYIIRKFGFGTVDELSNILKNLNVEIVTFIIKWVILYADS